MKQSHKRQTSLFLIELMAALLFFSLAATVSIQFFVQSNIISQQSSNLNSAILVTQSHADAFRASRGNLEHFFLPADYVTKVTQQDTDKLFSVKIYYDENWNPTGVEHAMFAVYITVFDIDGSLRLASIETYHDGGDLIYGLEVLTQS